MNRKKNRTARGLRQARSLSNTLSVTHIRDGLYCWSLDGQPVLMARSRLTRSDVADLILGLARSWERSWS
jgi:hypothetical protein